MYTIVLFDPNEQAPDIVIENVENIEELSVSGNIRSCFLDRSTIMLKLAAYTASGDRIEDFRLGTALRFGGVLYRYVGHTSYGVKFDGPTRDVSLFLTDAQLNDMFEHGYIIEVAP